VSVDLQAVNWWANHPKNPEWIAHYASSAGQPYRAAIVEALRRVPDWTTLFEVGCHCGPMLWAVHLAFPGVRLGGCDVNLEAVEFAREKWPGVRHGAFPGVTDDVPDRAVGVALSCYTLSSTSPDGLESALAEMARIASKAVVICEPMSWDGKTAKRTSDGFCEWRHPYFHVMQAMPEFGGWRATCQKLSYQKNFISGLIVVERP
jgi:hypothetical protein